MASKTTLSSHRSEPENKVNTRIPERLLWVAWISLLALTVLNLIIYIVGIPAYFAWFNSFHTTNCLDGCFTPATVQALHAMGISITAYAAYWVMINLLFALTYFAVAALIFWHKPYDWMAWLAAFSLVALGGAFPSIPGALVAAHPIWSLPVTIIGEDVLGFPSLIIFFFLFPTGRFVPRWTCWVAFGFAALFVPIAFFPGELDNASIWLGLLLISVPFVAIGSLVYAQVYRYRRVSTPIERQQTKWIVYGTSVALLGFLLLGYLLSGTSEAVVLSAESGSSPICHLDYEHLPAALANPALNCRCHFALPPMGHRHSHQSYTRLWLVDGNSGSCLLHKCLCFTIAFECVHRTTLIERPTPIVIVASTLGIAALFQPLRRYASKLLSIADSIALSMMPLVPLLRLVKP